MGSRRIWWVSVWAGLVGCSGSAPLKGAQGPPVVALVTIDTWRLDHFRADLTPRIWTLAKGGERYTQAWSPIGLTSPAHATMLTGKQPWEHGMEANNHHGFRLPAEVPRVLDHPEFDGIAKGAFVSAWPAGPAGGLDRGFDVFDGPESGERPGKVTVDRALEWLPTDAPAFIWVHVYEPHGPYEGLGATDAERYAEEVRKADKLLTPLLDALEARGSLIVVAADHGEVLLEEKWDGFWTVGSRPWASAELISLPDLAAMKVKARVHEVDDSSKAQHSLDACSDVVLLRGERIAGRQRRGLHSTLADFPVTTAENSSGRIASMSSTRLAIPGSSRCATPRAHLCLMVRPATFSCGQSEPEGFPPGFGICSSGARSWTVFQYRSQKSVTASSTTGA